MKLIVSALVVLALFGLILSGAVDDWRLKARDTAEAKLDIEIKASQKCGAPSRPLLVTIRNRGKVGVRSVSFRVMAKDKTTGEVVLDDAANTGITVEHGIVAGDLYWLCVELPKWSALGVGVYEFYPSDKRVVFGGY